MPQQHGRINFAHLIPNVQCDRCHRGSAGHVAAMRAGQSQTHLEIWPCLTSLESINRCGECHRRADEFLPDELTPTNSKLARFAPVGLAMSRCFQPTAQKPAGEPGSLTCLTCHDPHQPASSDPAYYRDRCLSCHDAVSPGPVKACPTAPRSSLCTTCHMPKVSFNRHLEFTDHLDPTTKLRRS